MEETTKQLLTIIAENQPKIKELGYNEGFGAGKKAEYDEFWEYQTATNYKMAFAGRVWRESNFYPKRNMYVDNANGMFQEFGCEAPYSILNLSQRLKECGVTIDFSRCTDYGDADTVFYSAQISHIPKCDFSKMRSRLYLTFASSVIVEIEELVVSDIYQDFQNTFNNANSLTTIKISGTITKSISFSQSPLTVESMKSIITHLKDYSGTENEFAYTVTFKTSAFEVLEAEGNTSPNGKTWTEYIDDLKWNLTLA